MLADEHFLIMHIKVMKLFKENQYVFKYFKRKVTAATKRFRSRFVCSLRINTATNDREKMSLGEWKSYPSMLI